MYLCMVVRHLAEQVVGHMGVSNVVEQDVQEAVAAHNNSRNSRVSTTACMLPAFLRSHQDKLEMYPNGAGTTALSQQLSTQAQQLRDWDVVQNDATVFAQYTVVCASCSPAVHSCQCSPDPLPLLILIVGQVGVSVLQEGDGHKPARYQKKGRQMGAVSNAARYAMCR